MTCVVMQGARIVTAKKWKAQQRTSYIQYPFARPETRQLLATTPFFSSTLKFVCIIVHYHAVEITQAVDDVELKR